MKRMLLIAAAVLASSPLSADWALKPEDHVMDRAEVAALIAGRTIVFYDEGRSKYSVGGSYSYTYASGESAFGQYQIEADGMVCVTYRNGFDRCDRYVENGGRIVLLTQKGLRFPVRQLVKK